MYLMVPEGRTMAHKKKPIKKNTTTAQAPTSKPLVYTVRSAAEALLLSESTIRKLINRGVLPVSRIGDRLLIQPKSLQKLLDFAQGDRGITTEFLNTGSLDDGYVDVTAESSVRETRTGNNSLEGPTTGSDFNKEHSK
jgi:excisionase family DNA binding protein